MGPSLRVASLLHFAPFSCSLPSAGVRPASGSHISLSAASERIFFSSASICWLAAPRFLSSASAPSTFSTLMPLPKVTVNSASLRFLKNSFSPWLLASGLSAVLS